MSAAGSGYFLAVADGGKTPRIHLSRYCRYLLRAKEVLECAGLAPDVQLCRGCIEHQRTLDALTLWQGLGRPTS